MFDIASSVASATTFDQCADRPAALTVCLVTSIVVGLKKLHCSVKCRKTKLVHSFVSPMRPKKKWVASLFQKQEAVKSLLLLMAMTLNWLVKATGDCEKKILTKSAGGG